MKNSKSKRIIIGIIAVSVAIILLLVGIFILRNKKPKAVYLEEISISTFVDNFNKNLKDSNIEYLANEDYLIKEDEFYWYGLYEDVVLHIVPIKYSGDLTKDIVLETGIFFDKGSANEELAMNYLANLIKTNDSKLTDEQVNEIIKQAKELGKDNVNKKNGTGYANYGLVVTYWDNEDNYHYSIERERKPGNEKNN